MTEPIRPQEPKPSRPAPKPRRRRLRPGPVFATGAATFVIALGLLGWQVAIGQDPSLGHGKQKPKVVNRTVHRTVIHRVYDAPKVVYVDPAPSSSAGYSGGGGGGYSGGGYSGGGYSGGGSSGGGSSSPAAAPAPSYTPPPPVSSGAS